MTLDDVYGADQDRFPLEQEAADRGEETPSLEWDEAEPHRIADGLISRRVTLH